MNQRQLFFFAGFLLLAACGVEPKDQPGLEPPNADAGADAASGVDARADAGGMDASNDPVADAGGGDVSVAPELPCLRVVPEPTVMVGRVEVGVPQSHEVTIENCAATAALEITAIRTCTRIDGVCDFDSTALTVEAGERPTLAGGERATFTITVTAEAAGAVSGELAIAANTPQGVHLVPVIAIAVANCPVAIADATTDGSSGYHTELDTVPLKTIQLRGSNSTSENGAIVSYAWTLIEKPSDSTTGFLPAPDVADPELFLDVAGTYVAELSVTDDTGESCGEPARVTIHANPRGDIVIQLTWDTPADSDETDDIGNDIDLHFLHPNGIWNQLPYDIFWNNPTNDWGVPGTSDDPSLDIDDTNGAGPEIISLTDPEGGLSYAIGVYYYADAGYGPAYATVRIYKHGTMTYEHKDMHLPTHGTFWYVATIEWPSAAVSAVNQVRQGFPIQP